MSVLNNIEKLKESRFRQKQKLGTRTEKPP